MAHERPKNQVGQYYLMEKIAQGGMAEIFKGLSYDVHGIKKTVCIKKILPHLAADPEFITSLIEEAKLAVKLVHGNIAQTFDLGKVGDDYFMVMEFVDGRSLSQIHKRSLANEKLIPIECLVYLISETLGGLDYMHRKADDSGAPLHVVHRDISPQNIMVSYAGTVKIIDFGIAKAVVKMGSTDSGILKGKFAYMSPEQAYGENIDHRSDIFSLGVILHEMLTGKRLFKADDNRQTIRNVRRTKVDPPSSFRGDVHEELDRITIKALTKDRRKRYSNASEMRDDLVRFLHRSYPDFRSSDVTDLVQNLFRNEMQNPKMEESDTKTPHLIIDRSNSALADDSQFEATGIARAPLDMSAYMMEETTNVRSKEVDDENSESGERIPELLPAVEASETGRVAKKRKKKGPPLKMIRSILFGVVAISVLTAIVSFYISRTQKQDKGIDFAELMIVTDPADARVLMDGRFVGQGSPVAIRNIKVDSDHVLMVESKGFAKHERNIKLEPGEFLSLRVTLARVAPMMSSIEIVTSPKGATVYINDKETSHKTPVTLKELKGDKKYAIGLFLASYKFWNKRVSLKGGETRSFDVQLQRDFGSISITSVPRRALILIDGVPAGQTPLNKGDLEPGTVYKIEVWYEGYLPQQKEVQATAGHKDELRFNLIKAPKKRRPQKSTGTEAPPDKP
jgi:serine/threonine protein kinase